MPNVSPILSHGSTTLLHWDWELWVFENIYVHTNIILYDTGYWENNKGDWIELNAQYLSSTYDVYGQTKNALSSPFVTFYLHIYSLVATCLTQV